MTNLYTAWALRFVPNAARGEFVNFGILAGRDDDDWALWTVDDLRRSRCIAAFQPSVEDLISHIAERVHFLNGVPASNTRNNQPPLDPEALITEAWVRNLTHHAYNALQFSAPMPALGVSANAVAESLFGHLVAPPTTTDRPQAVTRLRRSVRAALEELEVPEHSVRMNWRMSSRSDFERLDFALGHERPLAITQCIAFTQDDAQASKRQANSWSFLIHLLRKHGGSLTPSGNAVGPKLRIDRNIPVTVVHDLPTTAAQKEALSAAQAGWREMNITAVPTSNLRVGLREVAERARP